MIGKATIFAIAMLVPGVAFAADSTAAGAAPAVAAHDAAGAGATAKSDVKSDATVKTAKAKGHRAKTGPAADKKTESKS